MNAILLENLKTYDVIESFCVHVDNKPMTYIKLKMKDGKTMQFQQCTNTCEGIYRYYLEYEGKVNYLSDNLAILVKRRIMKVDKTSTKKNFGTVKK